MRRSNTAQRQAQILSLLSQYGNMKTLDLAEYFHVSRETIRQDIMQMAEKGQVRKCFGGIVSCTPIQATRDQHAAAKIKICEKALELLPAGASLFLDNGSTTLYLAQMLSQRSGYTIITPSLGVANACANGSNKLIVCGGLINTQIQCATGSPTVDFLKQLRTDIAVFGSDGFQTNNGPTGTDFEYGKLKRVAHENAQQRIVLADSSKSTYSALLEFASWENVNCLITDSGIDPEVMERIGASTEIILADI